jgi:cytochrome c556
MRKSVLIFVALLAGTALGHEHATGIVGERMKAMTSMGRELKAIGDMVVGETPFDAEAVRQHAELLHENCHHVEAMFPPGSTDHLSHAKPSIWERPGQFHEEMQRLHDASESLVAIAASGDRDKLNASFETLRDTCDSCHETFRTPEN